MSTQNTILAAIHGQLGQTLKNFFAGTTQLDTLIGINSTAGTLLEQLEKVDTPEDENKPPKITLFFVSDIIGSSISSVLEGLDVHNVATFPFFPRPEFLGVLRGILNQQMAFFQGKIDALAQLITTRNPLELQNAGQSLMNLPAMWTTLQPLIGSDIGSILSLAAIGNAISEAQQPAIVGPIEQALLDYFFKKEGYHTLDGANVVAPVHLSDVASAVPAMGDGGGMPGGFDQLKNLFSKSTAEHYLRDTIRVTVEAAYNTARKLDGSNGRYESTKQAVIDPPASVQIPPHGANQKTAVERKFINWFRGFSSVAESAAMRAVEIATQGVSEFQTNPLIAASAGSFAGTVARKIAQDSYLSVLRKDLHLQPF